MLARVCGRMSIRFRYPTHRQLRTRGGGPARGVANLGTENAILDWLPFAQAFGYEDEALLATPDDSRQQPRIE
jgi:hypothetical protein